MWTMCRILLPDHVGIDSIPMRMSLLFIGAHVCGLLISIINLPEMLGMIAFGFVYANLGFAEFSEMSNLEIFLRYIFFSSKF